MPYLRCRALGPYTSYVCVCACMCTHTRGPLIVVDLLRRGSVIVFGAFSIVWISNDSEPARIGHRPCICARVRVCTFESAWVSQCVARRRIRRNSHLPLLLPPPSPIVKFFDNFTHAIVFTESKTSKCSLLLISRCSSSPIQYCATCHTSVLNHTFIFSLL